MSKKIIIGTRGSKLALWQSGFVRDLLLEQGQEIELKIVRTKGDKILDQALHKIEGKGLFTKELENELLEGSIDIAVHSLKDIQTELPDGLKIAGVTKRENVHDVLIARKEGTTLDDIPERATIATGSLRRKAQLLNYKPDLNIVDIRGNVNTRINKFLESDWNGLILAYAGVKRLGLEEYISSIIPKGIMLPSVGQGALGIECRKDDEFINKLISSVSSDKTKKETFAERAFLTALGGGCQTPIACYAEIENNEITITGSVLSPDGKKVIKETIKEPAADSVESGKKLAELFLNKGADKLLYVQ